MERKTQEPGKAEWKDRWSHSHGPWANAWCSTPSGTKQAGRAREVPIGQTDADSPDDGPAVETRD